MRLLKLKNLIGATKKSYKHFTEAIFLSRGSQIEEMQKRVGEKQIVWANMNWILVISYPGRSELSDVACW